MLNECKNAMVLEALNKEAQRTGWVGGSEPLKISLDVSADEAENIINDIPTNPHWWYDTDRFIDINTDEEMVTVDVSYLENVVELMYGREILDELGWGKGTELLAIMEATEDPVQEYLENELVEGDYPEDYDIEDLWDEWSNVYYFVEELWDVKYFIHVAY